jgi:hypothetical protein
MHNLSTLLTPARATYLMGLRYRNTRTSCGSLALLCARISPAPLRRVLSQPVPWSRRLWDTWVPGLVPMGGSLGIEDTSWERFPRGADAVSGVGSSRGGQPVWGRPGVLVLWTKGKWEVPLGIRSWHKGGPSKGAFASGVLRPARRRGLQPASVLAASWEAAAELMTLLAGGAGST